MLLSKLFRVFSAGAGPEQRRARRGACIFVVGLPGEATAPSAVIKSAPYPGLTEPFSTLFRWERPSPTPASCVREPAEN